MGKSALTPEQVVKNGLTFAIPIYQRLFAWSEEQILPLLLDLLYCCVQTNESHRKSHYYIGLITTKNQDLVDGQQRFTVMTLLALVLREKMSDGKSWNSFLLEGDSLRLTFTARKNDEEFLRRLVDMENCTAYIGKLFYPNETAIEDYYNEMMAKGILTIVHFLDKLQNHVEETLELNSNGPSIDEFGNYIYEHLAFFIQEMPEGYSPRMMNKYFESMNSTGRNLENHEILKVDLLKAAFPGVTNDPEYINYVSMWNKASQMDRTIFGSEEDNKYISFIKKGDYDPELHPIEDKSMSIEDVLSSNLSNLEVNSQGKRETRFHSFLNFTDFLLQVLWLELKDKPLDANEKIIANRFFKRDNLCKTFNQYWKYIKPKDFIKEVYQYRIILDWAIIRIDGEGDYELLAESSSEYSKLEQYEAMLFASSSQYTYYHWLPLILKEVLEHGYNKDELLEKLKSIDNKDIHPKPKQDFNYESGIDTYYFRRLDYYIWEKVVFSKATTEELKKDLLSDDEDFLPGVIESIKAYKFHQYNSIEHLYPQNEDLQLELNKWSRNDLDFDHIKILNELGNLALISDVYNSTQNNQSLNHKFVNVAEHVIKKKIESIKLAIMYCCANGDLKNWTKPKAVEHKKKMMKILNDSYNNKVYF